MRISYILLFTIVSLLWGQNSSDSLQACLLPFPQEGLSRQLQKPGTYKQYELNRQVAKQYHYYCDRFLRESESGLYVAAPAITASNQQIVTTAEVHGVAMVLAVLMAREDTLSHNQYDRLYRFYKTNTHSNGRMRARVFTDGQLDNVYETGADLDIAYSLLLAHCQWGSEGEVNYLEQAGILLAGVEKGACNHELLRLHPGTIYEDKSVSSSNLFRPSYFRAFAKVGDERLWHDLEVSSYQIMEQFSGKSVTGFIPDYVHGETPLPGSGRAKDITSESYSYEGRRLTLHLALDLVHNKSKEAQKINGRMAHWLLMSCADDAFALRSGYMLSGQELNNYVDMPFIASSAVALSCTDSGSQVLDTLWGQMINHSELDAAGAGEKVLTMLLLSGNWWSPCGEAVMLSETTKSSLFSPHISLMENNLQVEGLLGSKVALSFHTLRGQLLYKKRVNIYENKLTEDLTYTNLTNGFHLLTLEGEGFTVTEKVIVSR